MKIFANGQGGRHRNTNEARTWRNATSAVRAAILAQYPEMNYVIAHGHAEDETASYLHRAARIAR
jgi:hypothetical protein